MKKVNEEAEDQVQQQQQDDNRAFEPDQQGQQQQNNRYQSKNNEEQQISQIQQGAQNTLLEPAHKRLPIYDVPVDFKYLKKHKYGNFIVIYDGPILISLGPDYLCFIPTFICFVFAAIGLNMMVFSFTQSITFWFISIAISIAQILSYFFMAISNPGIAQTHTLNTNESQIKYCKYCQLFVQKKTYHCRDCGFCVLGYDHHCPWTSKCIGKNNLKRFYIFLTMVPVFIVYCIVTFVIVGANLQHEARMRIIRTHTSQITF